MAEFGARRLVRVVAVVSAALMVTAVWALSAFGHATFPSSAAFDLRPNTLGGTGADGAAPPYPAGTTQTLYLRVPDEESTDQLVNTNVAVDLFIPAGWTSPVCGDALTNVNDGSTNMTNQPGTAVAGWTCELNTSDGSPVLHWEGPAAATKAEGAQYFAFVITVPSPAAQTTYNGAAGSGTEGFIVDQHYEGGQIVHWYPNEAYQGDPPEGATSELSANLARTVAAAVPAPVPTPEGPVEEAVTVAPTLTG
jgi:hypothetical protein